MDSDLFWLSFLGETYQAMLDFDSFICFFFQVSLLGQGHPEGTLLYVMDIMILCVSSSFVESSADTSQLNIQRI